MKRIVFLALVLALLAPASFAQSGDTRALGLAGAMTAVNDDMNSLFYNPAGLAFLRKSYFVAQTGFDMDLKYGLFSEGSSLPYVYYGYVGYDQATYQSIYDYVYYDNFTSQSQSFNFDDYQSQIEATMAQEGETKSYADLTDQEKAAYYNDYRDAKSTYEGMSSISVRVKPRLLVGGPSWGAALVSDYTATPTFPEGFDGLNTKLSFNVERSVAFVAGMGLKFGPIAVGANAKYIMDSSYSVTSYSFSDAQDGPPSSDIFQEILSGGGAVADPKIEVGLGALFTTGALNVGVYNDNVMPFLASGYSGDYFADFLNTMSFGASWMPSDNKFSKHKIPLVLMASADLKNFGDELNRQLCAGLETGLDLGNFIVALARVGYTQGLPGSLDQMASSFDLDYGTITMGMTAKLWFAKLDFGFALPMTSIKNFSYMGNTMTDAMRAEDFGTFSFTLSLDF